MTLKEIIWNICEKLVFVIFVGIILAVIFAIVYTLVGLMLPFGEKSHAKDFEVESNAKCMQICEQIMKDYKCLEATPSYTETLAYLYNNDELAGQRPARMCSCYVRGCKE